MRRGGQITCRKLTDYTAPEIHSMAGAIDTYAIHFSLLGRLKLFAGIQTEGFLRNNAATISLMILELSLSDSPQHLEHHQQRIEPNPTGLDLNIHLIIETIYLLLCHVLWLCALTVEWFVLFNIILMSSYGEQSVQPWQLHPINNNPPPCKHRDKELFPGKQEFWLR